MMTPREITSPATSGMPQQKTEYRLEELREYARERPIGLKLGKHTYIK